MEKEDTNIFDSGGSARSYIRAVAYQFPEPELMIDFINALEIAEAALVYCLIEENVVANNRIQQQWDLSKEFHLAVERLRATLAKLKSVSL